MFHEIWFFFVSLQCLKTFCTRWNVIAWAVTRFVVSWIKWNVKFMDVCFWFNKNVIYIKNNNFLVNISQRFLKKWIEYGFFSFNRSSFCQINQEFPKNRHYFIIVKANEFYTALLKGNYISIGNGVCVCVCVFAYNETYTVNIYTERRVLKKCKMAARSWKIVRTRESQHT